jgi:hypothetical protein
LELSPNHGKGASSCCPITETCMCRSDCWVNWGPGDRNKNDAYCSGGQPRISCSASQSSSTVVNTKCKSCPTGQYQNLKIDRKSVV